MSYDPLSPVALASVVKEIFVPKTFFRATFFNKFVKRSAYRLMELQILTGSKNLAPITDCNEDPATRKRDEYTGRVYKMPYSRQAIPLTCDDMFERKLGQTLFPTDQEMIRSINELIVDDMMQLNTDLDRREEHMCMQALTTGKVTLPGGQEADFAMKPSHLITLTGTDLWTDAASDPIAKIRELVRLLKQDSGVGNIAMVAGAEAYDAFLKNDAVKTGLDNRRINLGAIEPVEVGGAMRTGVLTDPNIELWTYDEFFKDPQSGVTTETEVMPVDRILLVSKNARNGFMYGGIAHAKAPRIAERWSHSYIDDKKGTRFLQMESSPLPALAQPNAVISAKVV